MELISFERYSPVANSNLILVVLSVCAAFRYIMEQLGADKAFIDNELKEQVYMDIPYGIDNALDKLCQLNKAIHGLM